MLGSYNEFWFERPDDMLTVNRRHLTSRIIDPPDGRVPALTAAARQRLAVAVEGRRGRGPADGPEDLGLPARCLSPAPVISPGGEANILQIVQTADHFVVQTELMSVRRIVPLRQMAHRPFPFRARSGDSIGRWEGDTLVVDTTNFAGPFDFEYAAVDENLHVTERFSRTRNDALPYEARIEDSTAFERPWTMVLLFRRTDARMFEFACHEGNYAMTHVLRGARAEEARSTHPK